MASIDRRLPSERWTGGQPPLRDSPGQAQLVDGRPAIAVGTKVAVVASWPHAAGFLASPDTSLDRKNFKQAAAQMALIESSIWPDFVAAPD